MNQARTIDEQRDSRDDTSKKNVRNFLPIVFSKVLDQMNVS